MKLEKYKGCKGSNKGIGPKSLKEKYLLVLKQGTSKKDQYSIADFLSRDFNEGVHYDDFYFNHSEKTYSKKVFENVEIFIDKFNTILYIQEGKIIETNKHLYFLKDDILYAYEKKYKTMIIKEIKNNEYKSMSINNGKDYLKQKLEK